MSKKRSITDFFSKNSKQKLTYEEDVRSSSICVEQSLNVTILIFTVFSKKFILSKII